MRIRRSLSAMATFLIQSKLRIRSRPGFYLLGEIVAGTVEAGMVANIWLDGGASMPVPIVAIEFVDFSDGQGLIALHIQCPNAKTKRCSRGCAGRARRSKSSRPQRTTQRGSTTSSGRRLNACRRRDT